MKKIIIVIFIMSLLWTLVCGLWTFSYAAVPHLINYQGRLTDSGGAPLNGAYNLTFKIYDSETAGNLLWEETQIGVVIQKGIFGILLGSVTDINLPFDKPYWLEIKVGTEVMSPRQRITSAGYAIRTETAEQANNATTVGNVGVSTAPTANKILPLDSNAKLPTAALKIYDSGWFAAVGGMSYTKTHNLGTTKVLITLYASANSDGSGNTTIVGSWWWDPNGTSYKTTMTALSTTQITVVTEHGLGESKAGGITSGYLRIIMLALE